MVIHGPPEPIGRVRMVTARPGGRRPVGDCLSPSKSGNPGRTNSPQASRPPRPG